MLVALSVGLVGMPNVGKSTLLNALSNARAEAANYPFCTIDKNVGMVEVPDESLKRLNDSLRPEECVPSSIQIVDIAGLVRGASRGEGLGNKFLGHIRAVDAVAHVVRCFDDPGVIHVDGSVDPLRDIEVVDTELALADLESAARTLERDRKTHTDAARKRVAVLAKLVEGLDRGIPIRSMGVSSEELDLVRDHNFLTAKPVLYVANTDATDFRHLPPNVSMLIDRFGPTSVMPINAKLECELIELPEEDRFSFMEEMGLEVPGIVGLVRRLFELLGLVNFYTIANNKLRAWKVVKGTKAAQAAGMIHSDMERGFIRAEIAKVDDVVKYGSFSELRKSGLVRAEGRDYAIQPEDVVHILFSE
jgi:GTP-binding protein YchF